MISDGLADELRRIERRRLRSLVTGDIPTAESLHADDYQLITPSGHAMSKREYLDAVASRDLHYSVFEATDTPKAMGTEDMAVLRYHARIGFHGATTEPIEVWHTDCYRRGNDGWQVVWSQATRIDEPE